MNIRPSFSRRLIPLLVAFGAILALVIEVGSAGASPATSPPIEPQSPADGVSLAATEEAIPVTFTCPSFVYEAGEEEEAEESEEAEEEEETGEETEEEEGEEGGEEEGGGGGKVEPIFGPPVLGNAENYGVHFSTSPVVAGDTGQLSTAGFGEAGEGEAEAIKPANVSCSSELELPKSAVTPATLYEGRIYWQAYRESEVAADGIEVGPVHSFVVFPHVEEPELTFREQIFAGYLTKVGLSYESELGGAVVKLQMWEGSSWTTLAEAPGSNRGENTFFVKPKKAGRFLFRPLVEDTGRPALGLETEVKAIRKPAKTRVTSAADDGPYIAASKKEEEESPIELNVTGGGTVLRNLKAEAETTCKGATKAQNVEIEVNAYIHNAKIAPDGTVFGVTKSKGTEAWTATVTGSLFDGRFQGELTTSYANCSGSRIIDAVLSKGAKK
jgi:hypothetical protein